MRQERLLPVGGGASPVAVNSLLVVMFTRQLSSMLASGVPILVALETLTNQPEDENFSEVICCCAEKIQQGGTFSGAVAQFPRVFPVMFQTMVQIGEQTGSLDAALGRLALWLERDQALGQRVRSALTYPGLVLTLAGLMALTIFYTIMPTFVSIFTDMEVELPWTTRWMMDFTRMLRSPSQMFLALAAGVASVTAFRRWLDTRRGARQFYRMCKRIPLVGSILTFGGLARYCSGMEALLSCGTGLTSSLRLAGRASGDPLLRDDAAEMVKSVTEGNPVGEHMANQPELYPVTLRSMVSAGEEASSLPEMFGRTAAFYELELNFKVEALGAALEPLLLAVVALAVAVVILSIFLPLYSSLGKMT